MLEIWNLSAITWYFNRYSHSTEVHSHFTGPAFSLPSIALTTWRFTVHTYLSDLPLAIQKIITKTELRYRNELWFAGGFGLKIFTDRTRCSVSRVG